MLSVIDEVDWDFNKVNTKEYTHIFHTYPAMMIPQIARRIIKDFTNPNDRLIFDPYCGSGTTLVEANIAGKSAIGTDLNPLARKIAQAKVTVIPTNRLENQLAHFCKAAVNDLADFTTAAGATPCFTQAEMDYWFPVDAQDRLHRLKHYVSAIADADIRLFFEIALSGTIRDVSYVNKGGYKRHRIKAIEQFKPQPVELMALKLERNFHALCAFAAAVPRAIHSRVLDFNTVETVAPLAAETIDAVVTSPPYGDSRTTVAYGEFSTFSLQWLGYDNTKGIDRVLMGGRKVPCDETAFPPVLQQALRAIRQEDETRGDQVAAFYEEYRQSIENVARLLKPRGFATYVVGNRIVKNQQLRTDEITAALFAAQGFDHIETIERNIPSKRMPRSNSPSNLTGQTVSTMNHEYIVVMRKR